MSKKYTFLIMALGICFRSRSISAQEFSSIREGVTSENPSISIVVDEETKGTVDSEKMSDYRVDSCSLKYNHISNEDELRKNNLRRCHDGTASFVQPDSEGWFGAEGKCGQTAASNILFMFCKRAAHPKAYADRYLSDITPGVRPGTLAGGLNDMFESLRTSCPSSDWDVSVSFGPREYILEVEKSLVTRQSTPNLISRKRSDGSRIYRKPVALLIRVPGSKSLHWVTTVDLERKSGKCHMFINHWDDQYKVPCHLMAKWSRGVGNSFGLILDSYTIVKSR